MHYLPSSTYGVACVRAGYSHLDWQGRQPACLLHKQLQSLGLVMASGVGSWCAYDRENAFSAVSLISVASPSFFYQPKTQQLHQTVFYWITRLFVNYRSKFSRCPSAFSEFSPKITPGARIRQEAGSHWSLILCLNQQQKSKMRSRSLQMSHPPNFMKLQLSSCRHRNVSKFLHHHLQSSRSSVSHNWCETVTRKPSCNLEKVVLSTLADADSISVGSTHCGLWCTLARVSQNHWAAALQKQEGRKAAPSSASIHRRKNTSWSKSNAPNPNL